MALAHVGEATGATRFSLLGASFTGGVCAYYAAKCPDELHRLVLLNPQLDYKQRTIDSRPYWTDDCLSDDMARRLSEHGSSSSRRRCGTVGRSSMKPSGSRYALEAIAYRYGSGPDDGTVAACVADLRGVHKDLERRAKVIAGLPKDICPENKVTPELARRKHLGLHPVAFIIDECQEVYSHPDHGKAAEAL